VIYRKAIIVGAPREFGGGTTTLAGVPKDVQRYRDFLLSNHGGAWASDEIVVLYEPSRVALLKELALAGSTAHYTLTIFSGHGGHSDKYSELCINQWESIRSIEDFHTGASRQLTICDTCRAIEPMRKLAEDKKGTATFGAVPDVYRSQCRMKFDEAIGATPAFREIMWACSVGETAADTDDGGLFSTSLISHALQWARETKQTHLYDANRECLDVPNAFAWAKAEVERYNLPGSTQTPELRTHRGGYKLPFAVA
jgi:caspase domain-containing protein